MLRQRLFLLNYSHTEFRVGRNHTRFLPDFLHFVGEETEAAWSVNWQAHRASLMAAIRRDPLFPSPVYTFPHCCTPMGIGTFSRHLKASQPKANYYSTFALEWTEKSRPWRDKDRYGC